MSEGIQTALIGQLSAIVSAFAIFVTAIATLAVGLRNSRKATEIHDLVNGGLKALKAEVYVLKTDLSSTRLELSAARNLILKLENHIIAMTREEGES
jgi:hypothetical protein